MADVKFVNVSECIGNQEKLDICTNVSSSVSVLQWQCEGQVTACPDKGILLETQSHISRARDFIKCEKGINAGLVLTPEYSFPYEILEEIIASKKDWPQKGKLWCLGMQGDSYESFGVRIAKWKAIESVKVIDNAFEEIDSIKSFFSPLVYLFSTKGGELCVIPQFKTGQMHDQWNEYEGAHLCLGNIIYIFDLAGESCSKNKFFSLICSDVLHIESNKIFEHIGDSNITLFHPQLNPGPRHTSFVDFRRNFLKTLNHRMITLNWAQNTSVLGKDTKFNTPWSVFYQRTDYKIKMLEADEDLRETRMKNHRKGLYYAYDKEKRINIWFLSPEEHCILFHISKSDTGNVTSIGDHRIEPSAARYYSYDSSQQKWIERNCLCVKDSLSEKIGSLAPEYSYPLTVCGMDPDVCNRDSCVMDRNDFFFGTCFGEFEKGQITCEGDELVGRITVKGDNDIHDNQQRKIDLFRKLVNKLGQNDFPAEFEIFKDNHRLEIDEERFPIMNKDAYNLSTKESGDPFLKAIVAVSELGFVNDVEKMVNNLMDELHSNYKGRVLVYYPSEEGYVYYSKHLDKTSIADGSPYEKLESITK